MPTNLNTSKGLLKIGDKSPIREKKLAAAGGSKLSIDYHEKMVSNK